MDDPRAKELLNKLRRTDANKRCAVCNAASGSLGFGSICVKYGSFVCDMCKASHQAYSHRCKSVNLSTWSLSEVKDLERMGGNARVRAVWLGRAPSDVRVPRQGDPLQVYTEFVHEVFELGKYKVKEEGEISFSADAFSRAEEPPRAAPVRAPRVPKPAPQVEEADLLDFSSEPVVSRAAPAAAAVFAAPAVSNTQASSSFDAFFGSSTPAFVAAAPAPFAFDPPPPAQPVAFGAPSALPAAFFPPPPQQQQRHQAPAIMVGGGNPVNKFKSSASDPFAHLLG